MPRGSINNRERAKQLNDFSNLQYGTITPTDLDGIIEYQDKAYVLLEIKHGENLIDEWFKPNNGQRIAFERLTDNLQKSGKETICIIATHDVNDPEKDVDAAKTNARRYRRKGKWINCEASTKEIIDNFLNTINKTKFSLSNYLR